jgi:hypothetical protein
MSEQRNDQQTVAAIPEKGGPGVALAWTSATGQASGGYAL